MAKKLTTKDILAAARAEAANATGGEAEEASAPAEAVGGDTAAAAEKPKASAGTPKSTKDILAAARAQAGGGGGESEKPAAKKPAAAKKAAGGKVPGSTADILAAARAQAKGGGAKESAKPQAAAKTSPKQPSAANSTGEKPSIQEMVKAVREGGKAPVEAAAVEKTSGPRVPKKPIAAKRPVGKGGKSQPPNRRNVLVALIATPLAAAWTMCTLTSGVFLLGLARFMFPNVLVEPPSQFKVGAPGEYSPGTVSTKWKAQFGVWIVHTEFQGQSLIYALFSICTHLGCTPNWLEGEQKFKCPCHGSGFYISGVNFEGPAPRPLERAGIKVAADGMLEVDKSVKFQQEMGQWDDPNSFVVMS